MKTYRDNTLGPVAEAASINDLRKAAEELGCELRNIEPESGIYSAHPAGGKYDDEATDQTLSEWEFRAVNPDARQREKMEAFARETCGVVISVGKTYDARTDFGGELIAIRWDGLSVMNVRERKSIS